MSREQMPPVFLDDFEDALFTSSLRIPPLQDPTPTSASRRPPTLEPNARLSLPLSAANVKLTTRIAALAEALPLGDTESDTPHTVIKKDPDEYFKGNQAEGQRKKQKLESSGRVGDFVQLPKPPAKAKVDMPPPFRPVSILHELHEPPPSAALFPPITPGTDEEQTVYDRNYSVMGGPASKAPKRMCLRPRMKWTDTETKDLLKGVESHGAGKWKKILNDPRLTFAQERTAVDLKDRYRTCRTTGITLEACELAEIRAEEETSPQNGSEFTTIPYVPTSGLSRSILTAETATPSQERPRNTATYPPFNPLHVPPVQHPVSIFQSTSESEPYKRSTTIKMSDVLAPQTLNIPHPTSRARRKKKQTLDNGAPEGESRKRRPKSLWTEREDGHLIQGYQKHGFQWTSIAKDIDLDLSHRTGPQVRDRFRLKFPEVYMSSSAIPYSVTFEKTNPQTQFGIVNDSTPQQDRYDIQDHKGPLENLDDTRHPSDDDDDSDSDYTDHPRSRLSSVTAAADEARHFDIVGLLNNNDEVEEDPSKLPSFKYPYDDVEEDASKLPSFKYTYDDWQGDSLTLPPLHWGDLAPKPCFELDD